MNYKIIIILLFYFSTNTFCQENRILKFKEKYPAKPIILTEIQQAVKVAQFILQYYGKSFKHFKELQNGSYNLENRGNGKCYLVIYEDNLKKNITATINLKVENFAGYSELTIDNNDIKRFINTSSNTSTKNSVLSNVTIVDKGKILFDQLILEFDDVPEKYWRILNKSLTENLENQYGDPLQLFRLAQSGVIIPYANGTESKLLVVDNQFHSIVYFDSNPNIGGKGSINSYYGIHGSGNGAFNNPTGIALGRCLEFQGYLECQLFVADQYNFRIAKVTYKVNLNSQELGFIDHQTFEPLENVLFPYDVAFVSGPYLEENPASKFRREDDKIWVSEAHPYVPYLSCFNEEGGLEQRFRGYFDNDTKQSYPFLPGTTSRVASYDQNEVPFKVVSFIDNVRNCLVSCKLDIYGKADFVENLDGYYIIAKDILTFPENENINSVNFQMTTPLTRLYPYVWVTSANKIHCLKMNEDVHTQYLASSNQPYNTHDAFSNLRNTISSNNYSDLFTIENWNHEYGIRRYLPFVDIYADTLFNYCTNNEDVMKYKAVFTNDCWIEATAERKNGDTWEAVKIKNISGTEVNDFTANIFRLAGNSELWNESEILIQLELPVKDYMLGGKVRLHLKLTPDNQNPYATENDYVYRDYEVDVLRNCVRSPIGCPYLYVKDENNQYTVDNNLLHRAEFSETAVDITDMYKLRIKPLISGGKVETYIVENEDDLSLIDQVKMYAVDYPPNRKVAVTEYNQVVLYDSAAVYGADTVLQNYTVNVTNTLHFHHPGAVPLVGNAGDSMYAHFNYFVPQKIKKTENTDRRDKSKIDTKTGKHEERAFSKQKYHKLLSGIGGTNLKWAFISDIGNLTYPIPSIKDTAGLLTATSVYNNITAGIFSRRELNSVVVLPLFTDTDMVNNIDIKWQSDHRMKYLGIAALEYGGYDINELPLAESNYITNSLDSEITAVVLDIDGEYTEVSSTSLLKMKFDASGLPELTRDYKREYIFEVTGQYSSGQSSDYSRKSEEIPLTYRLSQNYPNPFNPVTKINYELPKNSTVNLVIYDILGREVIRLLNNEFKQPGRYTVEFDGKNFASGIYFYRIEAGNFVQSKKMVLIK